MAFILNWSVTAHWIGDGCSAMSVPAAQALKLNQGSTLGGGSVVVPGGDSPTGANFTTAATTVGTNMGAALNNPATLAEIQGFSTGGG
jgi:hypothetical protein